MKEDLYRPNCIRTVSGQYVNLLEPDPDTILVTDIAHALSQMPRFGGHLPCFYTVAQHSINCSYLVPTEYKLQALMHDASEAYLVDVPSPLKALLTGYKEIENRFMQVIADKFGFAWPLSKEVHKADHIMLQEEWAELMLDASTTKTFLSPTEARELFMSKFHAYGRDHVPGIATGTVQQPYTTNHQP